jgi:hypothetical protein
MLFCPQCGAKLQSGDQFCHQCGQPLNPADPTQRLGAPETPEPVATPGYGSWPAAQQTPTLQSPSPGSGYGSWPAAQQSPSSPSQYAPPRGSADDSQNWASGSSYPGSNPYAGTPNTVSPGTMLNGRPIAGRPNKSILQGLGGAIVLALVMLGKFGGAIAALGIWKLFGLLWLFNWIGHGHSWVAIVVVLLIVTALWRQRS